MTPMRKKEIRHAMLQVLERAKPYMLEQTLVRDMINFTMRPRASLAEFEEVCGAMENARQIELHSNDDREVKIKITDEGMAELNE